MIEKIALIHIDMTRPTTFVFQYVFSKDLSRVPRHASSDSCKLNTWLLSD